MELKFKCKLEVELKLKSSNRTFMELKSQKALLKIIGTKVLIVPLWN